MRKIIITLLIVLLVINILYVFAGVLFHPLQSEDAIGIWLFKTKAFYFEGGFPNHFLHNPAFSYSHQQYPLGLPFLFSLFYRLLGGIKENNILLLYPLIYSAIIFFVYKLLRRKTSTPYALLFTYIYSMFSPLIASGGRILAGNADIFIVLIEWLMLLIIYKKNFVSRDYLLMVFLVMIASQIKLEGAFLSVILLFLPLSKKLRFSLFSFSLAPFLLWLLTIYLLKIPSDTHIIFVSFNQLLSRLFVIMSGIGRELINVNNWYLFWPLVGFAICIKSPVSTQMKRILLPSYGIIMALYIAVYLFSSADTYKYINSSFDRVLFQQSAIVFLFFFEKMQGITILENLKSRVRILMPI